MAVVMTVLLLQIEGHPFRLTMSLEHQISKERFSASVSMAGRIRCPEPSSLDHAEHPAGAQTRPADERETILDSQLRYARTLDSQLRCVFLTYMS
jgi:hypothetical protein